MKIFKKLGELFDKDYASILTQTKTGIRVSIIAFTLVMISIMLVLIYIIGGYCQTTNWLVSCEPSMYINYFSVNILTALIYGFLSFLSPLTPLILLLCFCYFGCISNISFEKINETDEEENKKIKHLFNKASVLFYSVLFIIGFFSATFYARATCIPDCHEADLQFLPMSILLAGIFMFILGFSVLTLEKPKFIPRIISSCLDAGKDKMSLRVGAVLVSCGLGFILGYIWVVQQINPYLNSVLYGVGAQETIFMSGLLLLFYFLGFGALFISSLFIFAWFLLYSKEISKYRDTIVLVSSILLMIIGLFILFNYAFKVPAFINWLIPELKK